MEERKCADERNEQYKELPIELILVGNEVKSQDDKRQEDNG